MPETETLHTPADSEPAVSNTIVAREMSARWPNLFGPGVYVPLKVGIDKTLFADAQRKGSALSREKIRLFLGWHVRQAPYLEAVKLGGPRHSINGAAENARPVSSANAAYAQEKLQAVLRREAPSPVGPACEDSVAWWNGLEARERTKWMKAAGDTGVPAHAWKAFTEALSVLA